MVTLTQFLHERAKQLSELTPVRLGDRHEWCEELNRLFAELKRWVEAADHERIVTFSQEEQAIREHRLGIYMVPTFTVALDGQEVRFIPIQRFTGGAVTIGESDQPHLLTGRIDVMSWGTAIEWFYRVGTGLDSQWVMKRRANEPEVNYLPLTQERFERLLMSALQ